MGLVPGDIAWIAEPGLRSSSNRGDWLGAAGIAGADIPRGGDETIPVSPQEIPLTAAVGFALEAKSTPATPG